MAVDLANGQRELVLDEAVGIILRGEHREARVHGHSSNNDHALVSLLRMGLVICTLDQDGTMRVHSTELGDRVCL